MKIKFPKFSGIRCLMMPYIQGDPSSVPEQYRKGYEDIIKNIVLDIGKIGYLTIDESLAKKGKPHRGDRSKTDRALHTEAGLHPDAMYCWGGETYGWGRGNRVTLERDTEVLLANSIDNTCAYWDTEHENTSLDGDIGHESEKYPFSNAVYMKAGEVHKIGILTPHESLPVVKDIKRQFLRIIGEGVHGREEHFTINPLMV
ncbi:hypothetical protein N9955_00390 [bacterium]|nr:hypothetical protein [bacterium]